MIWGFIKISRSTDPVHYNAREVYFFLALGLIVGKTDHQESVCHI